MFRNPKDLDALLGSTIGALIFVVANYYHDFAFMIVGGLLGLLCSIKLIK